MPKPTRYYVEWIDGEKLAAEQQSGTGNEDLRNCIVEQDFDNLEDAQAFKRPLAEQTYAAIRERTNIFDTTPKELRRLGIEWHSADFDDDVIED